MAFLSFVAMILCIWTAYTSYQDGRMAWAYLGAFLAFFNLLALIF